MAGTTLGTIAFLFTDIEGSTEMLRAQPEAYAQILAEHGSLVRSALSAHGGVERGTEGDSFFCTFATVGAAVAAAYDAQRSLAQHPFPHGGTVGVRMGIHVGAAADHSGEVVGLAVHYAARIAASGHGGQILLSSAARATGRDELPKDTAVLDLGPHRVKDFPDPEHLYQLVADDLRRDFPPLRTKAERSDNLPLALTSFVGREPQLLELVDLVAVNRLVTLVGPGGSGKTRMAVELAGRLAREFADGVQFVELAVVDDELQVDATIAAALGIREGSSGTVAPSAGWAPDRSARERLVELLRPRETLIVLDNCEHVAAACAAAAKDLLTHCRGLRIVATSQRQLGVPGEVIYRVPPLGVPDPTASPAEQADAEAVRLFLDRAARRSPGLQLDEAATVTVGAICRKLDGLAYAIELAAARIPVLSPAQILAFLADQPAFLTGGGDEARHQTLRGALDWSYGLLTPDEQHALRQLSVFQGSFDLDAACSVVDPDPSRALVVLDWLSSLAEKSLIETETEAASVRYRLLEGTRQYAAEKLAAAWEEAGALDRHAAHYLALAEEAEPHLRQHGMAAWLDRIEVELDNIAAGLDHLCTMATGDGAVRLASSLWHFFLVRGFLSEGRQHLARALKSSPDAGPPTLALATARLASLALFDGDPDGAELSARDALTLAGSDAEGIPARIRSLLTLGLVDLGRNETADARAHEDEALVLSEAVGDEWSAAYAHNNLGNVAIAEVDLEGAVLRYETALAIRRRLGDAWGMAWTLYRLGNLKIFAGQTGEARAALEEGSVIAPTIGFAQGRVLCLVGLGDVALADGDLPSAVSAYEEALVGAGELEDSTSASIALAGLAVVAAQAGDAALARTRLNDPRLETGLDFLRAFRLRAAGLLAALEGDPGEARLLLAESLAIRARLGDRRRVAEALDDLAALFVDDDADRAASLAGAAHAVREQVGAVLPPGRRGLVAAVHDRVGDLPAFGAGTTMTTDEAVAVALAG